MKQSSLYKLYALAMMTGVFLLLVLTTTYEYVNGPITHQTLSLSRTGFVVTGNMDHYVKHMLVLGAFMLAGILMTYRQLLIVNIQKKIHAMKEARKLPQALLPLVRALAVACVHRPRRKDPATNVFIEEMTTIELLLIPIEEMVFQMAAIAGRPLEYEMRELLFSTATLVEPELRGIDTINDNTPGGVTYELKDRIQKLKDLIREVRTVTDSGIKDHI